MAHLSLRNVFPCPPEILWEIFQSDEFDRRLEAVSGVRRETLETREEGGIEFRRIRTSSKRELPALVAKATGATRLVYEQTQRFDRAANALSWEVIPELLPGKVVSRGRTLVRATPEGSERVVEGEITVSVPLVGGQIEKALIRGVEQSYESAAQVALEMLRERR